MQAWEAGRRERGMIAVSPVSGWWKDQPKHDRSKLGVRYSLIVGIETEAVNTICSLLLLGSAIAVT